MEASISSSQQYQPAPERASDHALSIVEKLPDELWMAIFFRSLPLSFDFESEEFGYFSATFADPQLIPIVLASVCRVWRRIACNLPPLWSTCRLNYSHPELNRIWLNRAGTELLTLHGQCTRIAQELWEKEDRFTASVAFMNSILPYWRQWKHVKLDIGPFFRPRSDYGMVLMTSTIAPFLETLHLVSWFGEEDDDRPTPMPVWVPTMLSNAPALRELKLRNVIHSGIFAHRILNLTDLEIYHISTADGVLLLRYFPQLERYSIYVSYAGELGSVPYVFHNNLTHFHFKDAQSVDGAFVLDFVVLSSLICLHVENVPRASLVSFLDRSRCHLSEIKFSGDFLSSSDMTSILEHVCVNNWLKSLEFYNMDIETHLLMFLRHSSDASRLIFLEQLSFNGCRFRAYDGLLAECIASRCSVEQVVQLRKVYVYSHDDITSHPLDMGCIVPLEKPADWVEGRRSGEFKGVRRSPVPSGKDEETHIRFLLGG